AARPAARLKAPTTLSTTNMVFSFRGVTSAGHRVLTTAIPRLRGIAHMHGLRSRRSCPYLPVARFRAFRADGRVAQCLRPEPAAGEGMEDRTELTEFEWRGRTGPFALTLT